MKKINGTPKNLKELLQNTKYSIHYYQREYAWQYKQVQELIDDLTEEFLIFYDPSHERKDVAQYGVYFMGSVVLAGRENAIIDGQQRLTSLSLLLIYLRRRLADMGTAIATVDQMIYSESFGTASFNISVEDREPCLRALNDGKDFDPEGYGESVKNLYARFQDIYDLFPEEIDDIALPYFADWLTEKVYFIEIVTETEQDAHKVFVSMNDRGLSLTSAEMLKGYLLSEVANDNRREKLNDSWKAKMLALKELGKSEEEDCIKAWLRAKYAETIRENRKGAEPEDFDLIGGSFHKWVRDEHARLGLNASEDFERFIEEFCKFADLYIRIKHYEWSFDEKQPFLYFNAALSFTLQAQLCLAPIRIEDVGDVIERKLKLVSRYIDIYIYTRVTNYKSLDYSTIKYAMFQLTKRIRNLSVDELAEQLSEEASDLGMSIENAWDGFRLNFYTKKYIRHMLARITDFVERGCDQPGHYLEYVAQKSKRPFEVEHIITDHYEWYQGEYGSREEFDATRNRPGNLLLLDKSTNSSINDSRYPKKLPVYASDRGNVLSAALVASSYDNNPRFHKFMQQTGFEFKPYDQFGRDQIAERSELVKSLALALWTPDFEELASAGQ
jgi:uncharacterized protein with ParB-like and HNH nuclease domain